MRHLQASRAANRATLLNLSVDTNVNTSTNGSITVTQGDDVATEILTAPPTQQKFNRTEVKIKSAKPSQALANPNWRNRQMGPGAPLRPPQTAGLPKTEFQQSGGRVAKEPVRDVSPEDDYTVRGYRTTPVDPDFIHSAPLTKKDFRGAEIDSDDSDYDEDKYVRPASKRHGEDLGMGALIKLEPPSPHAREYFGVPDLNHGRKKDDKWMNEWQQRTSPARAVPLLTKNSSSLEDSIAFPTAEVKTIKDSRRFKRGIWDEQVERQVFGLGELHTTSNLSGYSRREYKNDRRPLGVESVIQDPAIEGIQFNSRRYKAPSPSVVPKNSQEEAQRYDTLIRKLNMPSDSSFAGGRHVGEQMRAMGRGSYIESSENSTEPRLLTLRQSPMSGSSISRMESSEKRNNLLNPRASEFSFSGQATRELSSSSTATYQNHLSPMRNDPPRNRPSDGSDTQEILAMMRCIRKEIAELRASTHSSQSQRVALQQQMETLQGIVNNMDVNWGSQTSTSQSQAQTALVHVPGAGQGYQQGNSYGSQQYGSQQEPQQGFQPGLQQYGGYGQTQSSMAPYYSTDMYGTGMGMVQPQQYSPGMYDNPIINGSTSNAPVYGGIQNSLGYSQASYAPTYPVSPAYGYNGPLNMQFATVPNANPSAFATPVAPSNLPLHRQAQIAFGPKPVPKPRLDDPKFAEKQQMYELWLEHMRATDPQFARQCKDRQARRSERQRSSHRSSHAP
ncbi:hypothetical protein F4805DRAFT_6199 [Annulohypoxylon moriforme]|nr:hypothetical protein F4805DRAFT_6199 [Annulohypoxylon moriforme]